MRTIVARNVTVSKPIASDQTPTSVVAKPTESYTGWDCEGDVALGICTSKQEPSLDLFYNEEEAKDPKAYGLALCLSCLDKYTDYKG